MLLYTLVLLLLSQLAGVLASVPPYDVKMLIAPGTVPGLTGALTYDKKNDRTWLGIQGSNLIGFVDHIDKGFQPLNISYQIQNVVNQEGAGILAILLDKQYKKTGYLYVYVAMRNLTSEGKGTPNQIIRLTNMGSYLADETVIFQTNENGFFENGGALNWYKYNGKWYFLLSDGYHTVDAHTPQDVNTQAGKWLLIPTDGVCPPAGTYCAAKKGNTCTSPIEWDNCIVALGNRNSFRCALVGGKFLCTDPGPDCNDELNYFKLGANYGFGPNWVCDGTIQGTNNGAEEPLMPVYYWNSDGVARPPTATGLAVCKKCGLKKQNGRLVIGFFHTGDVRSLKIKKGKGGVPTVVGGSEQNVYENHVPIVDLIAIKKGKIIFTDVSGAIKMLVNA